MLDGTTVSACLEGLAQVVALPSLWPLAIGVLLGGLVGILPGLGGAAAVALLLPFVFDHPPQQAFALLIGLISVTATTGDLTSILVGVPGEATAAATVVDGHPMARRGEAGKAIGASLASSLAGALFGALTLGVGISLARPLLGRLGSPELFMLALLGVACTVPLASASRLRGIAAGGLGFALATVGLDPIGGTPRFTLGQMALWDGLGLIPVALGLFAVPEIVSLAGRSSIAPADSEPGAHGFLEGAREAARRWPVVVRSSAIGAFLGLLPGVGASVSQWLAYAHAARRSPHSREFGTGAVEGVIAPSAANNATLGGALVPTVALGIPGSLSAAMLLSALVVKGLVPGARMLAPERDGGHLTFVFSLAWMMVLANILAVALTWGASRWLIKVTQVRSGLLVPILLLLVCVGAFTERNMVSDLFVTAVIGAIGLAFTHYGWPRSPLLIGLVLGSLAENRLFLSIQAYGAGWLARPGVLIVGVLIAASLLHPAVRRAAGRRPQLAPPAAVVRGRGELAMTLFLLATCAVALASTTTFPASAALFPRVMLGVTVAALGVLVASEYRGRGGSTTAAPMHLDRASLRTAASMPVFIALIWALGFVWGATLAVLACVVASDRRRPGAVVAVTLIAYLLLDVVMARLLHVPFPAGAVLEGARVIGLR